MANGALTSWKDVQAFLDAHSGNVSGAPHGAFWHTLTYEEFVTGCVPDKGGLAGGPPCVTYTGDQGGPTVSILVKGSSANSNIIKALLGQSPFDGSDFPQMPKGGPYLTPTQVSPLAAWIDAGCPQ